MFPDTAMAKVDYTETALANFFKSTYSFEVGFYSSFICDEVAGGPFEFMVLPTKSTAASTVC
jgi:hypothetical protein